jgi:sulfide:quinone oxidoreductase
MEVTTSEGTLRCDYLVIALGADLDMGPIPGLSGAAETFYTRDGAVRLRSILPDFKRGQIALLIPKTPFKCPPGPYEAAMMLHSYFHDRGLDPQVKLDIYTVEGAPMMTAGPQIGTYVKDRLAERGIGFHPQTQVQSVDGTDKSIVKSDGTKIKYDLLLAIPPHTSPLAVRESGLVNPAGWISADPTSLEWKESPKPNRIFAIGDVTSMPLPGRFKPDVGLVLPKAGVFAEGHAKVAAARIAGHILGREPDESFDGRGFCYIEVGDGKALRGDGSFFDLPHPTMLPRSPDAAQFAEKKAWIDSWMASHL